MLVMWKEGEVPAPHEAQPHATRSVPSALVDLAGSEVPLPAALCDFLRLFEFEISTSMSL
jgi:hypothetical protein